MSCWRLVSQVAFLIWMATAVSAGAATNCDATHGALVHGASTSVTDSTTSPTLTGGSATATCNNGTLVYSSATCVPACAATTVNWGAGCTASAPAILSGQNSALTNSNAAYTGTVTSTCTNGSRASSSPVCNADCNVAAGQTWVVGANTCTNPSALNLNHGAIGSRTDATQPTTGTASWSCNNGTATLQAGATCYAQCAAQAVAWTQAASNCTGTSAVLAHGANGTVSDATAPTTGNVNITCNNGVLAESSPACTGTNSCAATTLNWTQGGRSCSDTVVAGVHGNTQALADTTANIAPGGTGTASAQCVNGAWSVTSPVCDASCGTQTVSWNPGCEASSGVILAHGGTRNITNATSGYTGTRDIECNNGIISQSGGSCTAAGAAGALYCWGQDQYGEVGNGSATGVIAAPQLIGSSTSWEAVSAGETSTCGIDSGKLYCWGNDGKGQVGNGSPSGNVTAPQQIGSNTSWSEIAVGNAFACGIDGGKLFCWGEDASGKVGNGSSSSSNVLAPQQIGSSSTWETVSTSPTHSHACAIDAGKLYCWGLDSDGQVGNGATTGTIHAPQQIGSSTTWTHVVAGGAHTCGINAGQLYCWGLNTKGQVGNGSALPAADVTAPQLIGSSTTWTAITGGDTYSCGIDGGKLYCWGESEYGELGDGTWSGATVASPQQVGSSTAWTFVKGGGDHVCGINAGTLYCWGANDDGELGIGTSGGSKQTPQQVGAHNDWIWVSGGEDHSCAIRAP